MTMSRRWWYAAAIGVVALGWFAMGRRRAIDVDVGVVSVGPLRTSIGESGTTRVRGHADVSAPVAGRWVPSALRAGDPVRAGTKLGTLFPAPLDATTRAQAEARLGAAEAAQREAETRVTSARTALDDAARSLARIERVAEAGGVSPQDLERARDAVTERRSEFEGAQLRARAARYERDVARAVVVPGDRQGMPIASPVNGTLLRLFEEHERVVAPGSPLAEVGDPADLEVIVPLLTTDASRVRVGATVILSFGAAGDTVRGLVTRIEPSAFTKLSALGVEEQRVNLVVTAPATDMHVGDQYRVNAKVTVWEAARVLRVPVGALVRDGANWLVYVVANGRAARRSVSIGERSEELAEVRSGVSDGESVVLYPHETIRDGVRVRVMR